MNSDLPDAFDEDDNDNDNEDEVFGTNSITTSCVLLCVSELYGSFFFFFFVDENDDSVHTFTGHKGKPLFIIPSLLKHLLRTFFFTQASFMHWHVAL